MVLSLLTTLLACEGGGSKSSKDAGSSGGGSGNGGGGGGSNGGGGSGYVSYLGGKILPKLALGDRHSCAVTDDEQALCWGKGTEGQLGNSLSSSQGTPVYVVDGDSSAAHIEGIVQISAGSNHACALNIEGKVFCWGRQSDGQLGNGATSTAHINYPATVDLSNIVQIASLDRHTCALGSDGEVFCWGRGVLGQLGNNADGSQNLPVKVVAQDSTTDPLTGIIQIAIGSNHTCALNFAGEVFCWGQGTYGQRGDNRTTNINYPVKVVSDSVGTPLSNIAQVVTGSSHTCALNNDGNVFCWGYGANGRLGHGEDGNSSLPVSVVESDGSQSLLSNVTQISAGYRHTCTLKTDSTLVCWGLGDNGQIGNNAKSSHDAPVIVVSGNGETSPLTNIIHVAAGGSHTCALSDIGNIYCWGNGSDGALADNDASITHDVNYPALTKAVGAGGILSVGTFKKSYYKTSDGLEIEKARISTLGTYPHQVTPFDADNSQYNFYSDSKCENKFGNSNSNSAIDLPRDVERIYFKKGKSGCSVSYFTYGFDRIPPSSIPISLIPTITVEPDQSIPFEVEGFEEGDHFGAFSDANCTDPLTEKIVTMTPTQEGIILAQPSDFILYGQFYDTSGNPGHCEQLQEVTVINQRLVPVFGVSEQPTFVGPRINGGKDHTCVMKNNQEIDCWGKGSHGRLGDDKLDSRGYPHHVIATNGNPNSRFSEAIQVVAGEYHSCALKENGTVYCWGYGTYLGINSITGTKDYPVPVTVSTSSNLSGIKQISSFNQHTCAVNSSGNVYCWGKGQNGEIGNGTNNNATRATSVVAGEGSTTSLTGISKVSTGGDFTCALKTDGGVLCWGKNEYGQLGDGNTGASHNTNDPVAVIDSSDTAIGDISDISVGNEHSCALTNAGKVLCWGAGTSGQLGNDAMVGSDHPVYVVDGDGSNTHLTGIIQISSGFDFTCALDNIGNVYCWGAGIYGKLGNDATTNKDHPVHVVETNGTPSSMFSDVVQIGVGFNHVCALKSTGKIFCWGQGHRGRLGDNDITIHSVGYPVSVVTSFHDTTPHDLGNDFICTTDANGIETCNLMPYLPTFMSGQLDEGISDSISIDLDNIETIADISFYSDQYCNQPLTHTNNANPAIISNLPWGETHIYFKRGARSFCYNSSLTYLRIYRSFHTRERIVIGKVHTCALKDGGEVLCWGEGSFGRLGNNATDDKDHPVQVKSVDGNSTLDGIVEISAGGATTCALKSNGKVLCWGFGSVGQLGNDKSDETNKLPTYVVDGDGSSTHLTSIVQISVGAGHSCALKADGGVLCWGEGKNGSLGNNANGTANKKDHPVAVKSVDGTSNLGGITYISAGRHYTCALSYTQNIYCWGFNSTGQLGNDTTTNSLLPVLVVDGNSSTNPLSEIIQVSPGKDHTCALKTNGNAYCWGEGQYGSLGNGNFVSRNYPVLVVDGQSSTTALANITQIDSGTGFACALNKINKVLCWGEQNVGKSGDNEFAGHKNYPDNVKDSSGATASDITGIFQVTLGDEHACALKNDGKVSCWGRGGEGRLGNDGTTASLHATKVIDGDGSSTALDLGTPTFSSYTCTTIDTVTNCVTD